MTTKAEYLNFDFTDSDTKHTLKSLNQPKELFDELYRRKFGLGIIAGIDAVEIKKTLFAIANAYEGYRGSMEIRTEESEPLPGVVSLNITKHKTGAKQVMRRGHNSYLIIMDAVDTPEKLELAARYASAGGLVIAPVISSSLDKTVNMLSEVGQYIAPYSFANSFTYIAQQTLVHDPFTPGEPPLVTTHVEKIDDDMRNALIEARYRSRVSLADSQGEWH